MGQLSYFHLSRVITVKLIEVYVHKTAHSRTVFFYLSNLKRYPSRGFSSVSHNLLKNMAVKKEV
jgi:hypothetical protein